jgi:hypothetical protein
MPTSYQKRPSLAAVSQSVRYTATSIEAKKPQHKVNQERSETHREAEIASSTSVGPLVRAEFLLQTLVETNAPRRFLNRNSTLVTKISSAVRER